MPVSSKALYFNLKLETLIVVLLGVFKSCNNDHSIIPMPMFIILEVLFQLLAPSSHHFMQHELKLTHEVVGSKRGIGTEVIHVIHFYQELLSFLESILHSEVFDESRIQIVHDNFCTPNFLPHVAIEKYNTLIMGIPLVLVKHTHGISASESVKVR